MSRDRRDATVIRLTILTVVDLALPFALARSYETRQDRHAECGPRVCGFHDLTGFAHRIVREHANDRAAQRFAAWLDLHLEIAALRDPLAERRARAIACTD